MGQRERQGHRCALYHMIAAKNDINNTLIGITNQRETTVAWSRKTGKPLCKAIVWTDSRTKNTVAHFEQKLKTTGIQISPGVWNKEQSGIDTLRKMCVSFLIFLGADNDALFTNSTGLPLSTYFSAIKLRWMIDNYPEVERAHKLDDLLFGTIESWVAYVCCTLSPLIRYHLNKLFRICLVAFRKAYISVKSQMRLELYCSIPLH